MSLRPPADRSNNEDMGSANGYDIRYDRITRSYTISNDTGSLTVRLGAVSSLALALGHVERDSDRRHFTDDDGPISDGPTFADDDPDDDPEHDDPDDDFDPDFDPDDVADLIEHDIRAHAAAFGPDVQVFRF